MSVQSWYDRDVSDVAGLLAEEHVARTLLKEADLASSLRDIGGQFEVVRSQVKGLNDEQVGRLRRLLGGAA